MSRQRSHDQPCGRRRLDHPAPLTGRALEFLQEKGLLAPVEEATLSHTLAQYNSPQGDWVGVSARVSVIVYNPSLIPASQLPASVMQLADPKYQNKLALAPSETDFQPIVTSVTRTYGKSAALAWLGKVKANAASHVVPDNESLVDEVNRGQVVFGVVNQYYWYRLGPRSVRRPCTPRSPTYRYHGHDAVVDVQPGDETGAPPIVVRVAGGSPHLAGSAVGLRVRGPVFAWPAD